MNNFWNLTVLLGITLWCNVGLADGLQEKSRLSITKHQDYAAKYLSGAKREKIPGGSQVERITFSGYEAMIAAAKANRESNFVWINYPSELHRASARMAEINVNYGIERGTVYYTERFVLVPAAVAKTFRGLSPKQIDEALTNRRDYSYCVTEILSKLSYQHDLKGIVGGNLSDGFVYGEQYQMDLDSVNANQVCLRNPTWEGNTSSAGDKE